MNETLKKMSFTPTDQNLMVALRINILKGGHNLIRTIKTDILKELG